MGLSPWCWGALLCLGGTKYKTTGNGEPNAFLPTNIHTPVDLAGREFINARLKRCYKPMKIDAPTADQRRRLAETEGKVPIVQLDLRLSQIQKAQFCFDQRIDRERYVEWAVEDPDIIADYVVWLEAMLQANEG